MVNNDDRRAVSGHFFVKFLSVSRIIFLHSEV